MFDYSDLDREQQSAVLSGYRASLPRARQRFVDFVATREPTLVLDSSLASIIAANGYFLDVVVAPLDETVEPLPFWWDPAAAGPLTPAQLELIDGIQAYAAGVAELVPGAVWGTFQGHKKDFRNGDPVLFNSAGDFIDICSLAYGEALDRSYRGRSVPVEYLHDLIADWAGVAS